MNSKIDIIDKRKQTPKLKELLVGDYFILHGELYRKTELPLIVDDKEQIIKVSDGRLYRYPGESTVILVDVKLEYE